MILDSTKSVLLTGGAGFIGSYFAQYFLEIGMKVYVLDNLSTGTIKNLPVDPNLIFFQGDVMKDKDVQNLPKVDIVVHLAGIVGMRLAKKNAHLAYLTSVQGSENIIKYTGDTPIVLLSSSSVYGLTKEQEKVKENSNITIENLKQYDGGVLGYAAGKWQMEQIGLREAKKGRKILIIRPFNVVGRLQLATYGMVLPSFIQAALKHNPVIVYGDGMQSRCFSDVKLFVKSAVQLMNNDDAWQENNNIFNVGSEETISIQSLAEKVIHFTRSYSSIVHVPFHEIFPHQKDVLARRPDTSHAQQFINKIVWTSIEDVIQDCI